jgi:CheY-like chemotaxis protein
LHQSLSQACPPETAPGSPAAHSPSGAPGETPAPVAVSPVKILIAEDNPVNQKVAYRQLRKLGYAADAVANGQEVLTALKRIPYEIILMDCSMPEMDGYEATRQIRSGRCGPNFAHIIAMTANAMQGDRDKCLEAGMDDYISKPVRLEDLRAALQRYVPEPMSVTMVEN